jgi:DNA-binding response OmpR family regulator
VARNLEILFVDDEANIRLTLSLMLQHHGFTVTTAGTLKDALQLIGERQFDVLLSDLNIERAGDGFVLVNAMRSAQPKALRLILTGYPDIDSALKSLREGVDDYLIKPTETEEIIAKIRSKLDAGRAQRVEMVAKTLGEILQREQESITAQWLEIAKGDPDISRIKLSDAQRTDHVPRVLAVAVAILQGKKLTAENSIAAAAHGQTRFEQGYPPALLIREKKLLEEAISACVHRNLLEIQMSTLMPGMSRAFGIMHDLLEHSLTSFLKAAKRQKVTTK